MAELDKEKAIGLLNHILEQELAGGINAVSGLPDEGAGLAGCGKMQCLGSAL